VGPARFGFAPKLLLVQPGQLPFERFELLHTPADHEHQLRAGALGGQSLGFPLLLALDRSGMLGPVIMSGLSITPLPQRGRWLARRANLLVEAKHEIKRSRVRAACPAQNAGIGGFTEGLRAKTIWGLCKSFKIRELAFQTVEDELGCQPPATAASIRGESAG
jgi:hypothetical protein